MITLLESPNEYSAVYNPIYVKVSSDQTTQEAFNFVFKVYVNGSYITKVNLPPNPGTIEAVFSPAKILESYVSYDLSQNVIADQASVNCIDVYTIETGEEYIDYWYYNSIGEDTFTSTSYTVLTSTNPFATPFSNGDYIIITQFGTPTYLKYNGVHKVVAVLDAYNILIDVNWTDASPTLAEGGKSTWSDKRKTTFMNGQQVIANPTMLYSRAADWTYYGPDGCNVEAGIFPDNTMKLVIPDVSCGTNLQQIMNTYTVLTPGLTYNVTINISSVTNPSGEAYYARAILGGTAGPMHSGVGTFNSYITCGVGNTFKVELYMDADTAGFGSHSISLDLVDAEILPINFKGFDVNTVLQYEQVPSFTFNDYNINYNTTLGKFLTYMPSTVKVKLDERASIGFMHQGPYDGTVEYYVNINVTDRTGAQVGYNYELNVMEQMLGIDNRIIELGVGPWNINQFSTLEGDGNIIGPVGVGNADTIKYEICIVKVDGIGPPFYPISEVKTFELDYNCSKFESVRFMFLNSFGQFDYFTATMLSRTNINVNRDTYTKTLNQGYVVGDRGRTVINVNANETYIVWTDWISETTAYWLVYELGLSKEVYVLNLDGSLMPVIIDMNTLEPKKRVNDQLFNYQISYSKAVNINTQRG